MIMRNLATLVLLAAAILTSWLAWQLRPQPAPDVPGPPRSDYSLDQYELVVLDEHGEESFTVRGPILSRDPNTSEWFLNQPRFSFPTANSEPWLAQSQSGWVSAHAEEVRLQRDVQVLGPAQPSGERARLVTAAITVFPKQNLARSTDSVTITQGGSILRGQGMETNFQTHQFRLFSEVRARYEIH
ncbi:MAG: LPS export ABC transporter periplasmic protein LptC [Gammaproteobacteria bacterium HGW-Gammaproteobacteria-2]|jgi:lipopolysaccharide export system protein LptC|nr:MAG: LPS export ABC transporter periplasmic protein LptC [Gammaproteobacteria bacterium HGW-Gammaproteobacteria-2]